MSDTKTEAQRSSLEVAQEHALILTQALPWVKALAGKTIVIKYGGAAMVDETLRASVMEDIMLMKLVGARPVIVHGGGKDISALVEKLGLPVEFKNGLRVTTPEVMRVVSMVLSGKVNEELVLALNAHGNLAVGLVGSVKMVDPELVNQLCDRGYIPVIASVGIGPEGQAVNVNADTFASALAQTCNASKIIFLTDVDGLYRDFSDKSSLISRLTAADAQALVDSGTLSKGMIPKVRAVLDAIDGGVERAHILNGTVEHSLVLELFTDCGVGTMIARTEADLHRHDILSRVKRTVVNK